MMYDQYVSIHGYGIGPLHLLVLAAVIIVPFWQLFSKAGYSGWFSFLMVLPLINLIALDVLAFSDWPSLRKTHDHHLRRDGNHTQNSLPSTTARAGAGV